MNRSSIFALSALTLAIPALSHAGYVAGTNITATTNTGLFGSTGSSFAGTAPGTFAYYVAGSPQDLQIAPGDLANFRFTFAGSVLGTGATTIGSTVDYTGTYSVTYAPGNILVSSGTVAFTATKASTNLFALTGALTQVNGPANPAFGDLSYGGKPIYLSGNYFGNPTDATKGNMQLSIEQAGQPVPEPATMAALGLGVLGLLKRRRKA